MRLTGVDSNKLFSADDIAARDKFIAALERRFLQAELKPAQRKALNEFLDARGELDSDDILGAVRLVMCTPDYQLT